MSPRVEKRALSLAIHVIGWFGENASPGCLDAFKDWIDTRDTKRDGVRSGTLQCRRSGVGVCAGYCDYDGSAAMHELTPIDGVAKAFCERQVRREPRDCCGHIGVIQHGYYSGIRC